MNIKNTWQDDNRGLHREFSGDLSISNIFEATLELQASPLFESLHYLIEDYSNATNPPFGPEDVEDISNFVRIRSRTKSDLKVAIVSRDSPEFIAVANGFREQMKQCHYQCEVFQSLAKAQAWAAI